MISLEKKRTEVGNEGQRINIDWIYHHNLDRTLEITSRCLVIITKKATKQTQID